MRPRVALEGLNNKIRVLKRRCYGLFNLGHFFQRQFLDLEGYRLFAAAGNTLDLVLRNLGQNEFMGPFLIYPNGALTDDGFVEPFDGLETEGRVVYIRSLIPPGLPRYARGGTPPKITSAYVSGNVTLTQSTRLCVHVDQPPMIYNRWFTPTPAFLGWA